MAIAPSCFTNNEKPVVPQPPVLLDIMVEYVVFASGLNHDSIVKSDVRLMLFPKSTVVFEPLKLSAFPGAVINGMAAMVLLFALIPLAASARKR